MIKEDEAGQLIQFNLHTQQGGYLVEAGKNASKTVMSVIDQIMAIFK
jgi:hypothetical protein